jgi:hypothetical protein
MNRQHLAIFCFTYFSFIAAVMFLGPKVSLADLGSGGEYGLIQAGGAGFDGDLAGNNLSDSVDSFVEYADPLRGPVSLTPNLTSIAGTQALPAYSFLADENTGVYRVTGDTIGMSAGGNLIAQFIGAGGSPFSLSVGDAIGLKPGRRQTTSPTEPFACASNGSPSIMYVKDTDDGGRGTYCGCVHTADATFDWVRLDDTTAACPFF